jgi:PAN domain
VATTKGTALRRLKELRDEAASMNYTWSDTPKLKEWQLSVRAAISRLFGESSHYLNELENVWWTPGVTYSDTSRDEYETAFRRGAAETLAIVAAAIREAEDYSGKPSRSNPEKPRPMRHDLSDATPLGLLRAAVTAVPAVRYALGVGGVAAIVAIVLLGWKLEARTAILGSLIVFVFMVVLVVFAALAGMKTGALRSPALFMAWTFLVLMVSVAGLFVSCAFFDRPKTLECLMGGKCNPNGDGYTPEVVRLVASPGGTPRITVEPNTSRPLGDFDNILNSDLESCVQACLNNTSCVAYDFDDDPSSWGYKRCWLKNAVSPPVRRAHITSGLKRP